MSLYSEDGSLWFKFELSTSRSGEWIERQRDGFKPLSFPYGSASIVLLRLVGESDSWYKVEINEETREVKYVLKSDPNWAETTYAYWLAESGAIEVGGKQQLRKSPDGELNDEVGLNPINKMFIRKIDGDWVYVEDSKDSKRLGWIRWKEGRNIIVSSLLDKR